MASLTADDRESHDSGTSDNQPISRSENEFQQHQLNMCRQPMQTMSVNFIDRSDYHVGLQQHLAATNESYVCHDGQQYQSEILQGMPTQTVTYPGRRDYRYHYGQQHQSEIAYGWPTQTVAYDGRSRSEDHARYYDGQQQQLCMSYAHPTQMVTNYERRCNDPTVPSSHDGQQHQCRQPTQAMTNERGKSQYMYPDVQQQNSDVYEPTTEMTSEARLHMESQVTSHLGNKQPQLHEPKKATRSRSWCNILNNFSLWPGNSGSTTETPSTLDVVKEDDQKSPSVKVSQVQQHCPECLKKDNEIQKMRAQTYKFMMEIELHLEGKDLNKQKLDWNNLFEVQALDIAELTQSDTMACTLFQACYKLVRQTVIRLCGSQMECLFTVYNATTPIPYDMKDIKNERCRCYLLLVSTFQMNTKCPLDNLKKQIRECVDSDKLDDFLEICLKLAWKLATCVPPMIISCCEKRYDRKIHSRVSAMDEVPDEYTLEYRSPVLYTNYTGHVQAKGKVEIISVSEINHSLQLETGPEKPSLELVTAEVSDELKDVVTLQKFAHALGMPQNKIDCVFNVAAADIKDNLYNIITWWITRRRIEPQWDKLADAVKNTGYHELAANIKQKYCKDV